MGESDEVLTEELRVGGESEGVREAARDEGVYCAWCLWGRGAYDENDCWEA
jgi:hypothetical protein